MTESYMEARRRGEAERRIALQSGRYPYLTALDEILKPDDITAENRLGMMEIPLEFIVGTKTRGRQEAFSLDFMPILPQDSEFAGKWSSLYAAIMEEGLRDPVKVYEYLGNFYVEEGNKRVSVSKFNKAVSIPAEVIRLMPERNDNPENVIYYEFVDFFRITGIYGLRFRKRGQYEALLEALKKDPGNIPKEKPENTLKEEPEKNSKEELEKTSKEDSENISNEGSGNILKEEPGTILKEGNVLNELPESPSKDSNTEDQPDSPWGRIWTEELRKDFKAALSRFRERFERKVSRENVSESFLMYIKVYGIRALQDVSDNEIDKNIESLRKEYRKKEDVSLIESPEVFEKHNILTDFFSPQIESLKAAFIYEKSPESSTWCYLHELGRNAQAENFGEKLETRKYENCQDVKMVAEAINDACSWGAGIIFTTCGMMADEALKGAVEHKNVRILNCSVHTPYSSIRTYYGKMYEAKFLMGALASLVSRNEYIGYVEMCPLYGSLANINAFSLGARLVRPDIKIVLGWQARKKPDWKEKMDSFGITVISGSELTKPGCNSRAFGVYDTSNGDIRNLATAVFNWGEFYKIIIKSVFDGSWENPEELKGRAVNLLFGLKSGCVDLILSSETEKDYGSFVNILRNGIINKTITPFDGRLADNKGNVIKEEGILKTDDIITMGWLNENVIGEIPPLEEFDDSAVELINTSGFYRDTYGNNKNTPAG